MLEEKGNHSPGSDVLGKNKIEQKELEPLESSSDRKSSERIKLDVSRMRIIGFPLVANSSVRGIVRLFYWSWKEQDVLC